MAEAPIKLSPGRPRFALAGKIALLTIVVIALLPALATMRGCDDKTARNVESVKIGGQWFHLEVAADSPTRMKGLGQRTHIEPDGGMLFVFPYPQDHNRGGFVMRDCPVDIDIIFLDPNGRIGNWHAMKAEKPRGADGVDEGKVGDFGGSPGAEAYERRLASYPSRYDYQFAVELAGGTIESKLKGKIHEGEKIDLPLDDLKKRAK
jgi:uncharacterized protein